MHSCCHGRLRYGAPSRKEASCLPLTPPFLCLLPLRWCLGEAPDQAWEGDSSVSRGRAEPSNWQTASSHHCSLLTVSLCYPCSHIVVMCDPLERPFPQSLLTHAFPLNTIPLSSLPTSPLYPSPLHIFPLRHLPLSSLHYLSVCPSVPLHFLILAFHFHLGPSSFSP